MQKSKILEALAAFKNEYAWDESLRTSCERDVPPLAPGPDSAFGALAPAAKNYEDALEEFRNGISPR